MSLFIGTTDVTETAAVAFARDSGSYGIIVKDCTLETLEAAIQSLEFDEGDVFLLGSHWNSFLVNLKEKYPKYSIYVGSVERDRENKSDATFVQYEEHTDVTGPLSWTIDVIGILFEEEYPILSHSLRQKWSEVAWLLDERIFGRFHLEAKCLCAGVTRYRQFLSKEGEEKSNMEEVEKWGHFFTGKYDEESVRDIGTLALKLLEPDNQQCEFCHSIN